MLFALLCYQSAPLSFSPSPLFYIIFLQSPPPTCIFRFYGADTYPISPSPKSLGVVVKAGKQGSVSCRTLNALAAAFSLSFSFLILILFCGTVRCVTFKWLAVPFLLDLACLRRSSSLGWAPGPTYTLVGASPSITPQFKLCI